MNNKFKVVLSRPYLFTRNGAADSDSLSTDHFIVEQKTDKPGWQRSVRLLLITLLTLLIVGVSAILFFAAMDGLQIGVAAPDFSGRTLQNQTVRLSDYRGQPVMLVFWSPDCHVCREELPTFQALANDPQAGITLLTVVSYQTEEIVRNFANAERLTLPIVVDPSGAISEQYNVRGVPFTYLINAQGIIEKTIIGGGEGGELQDKLFAWRNTCAVKKVCQ